MKYFVNHLSSLSTQKQSQKFQRSQDTFAPDLTLKLAHSVTQKETSHDTWLRLHSSHITSDRKNLQVHSEASFQVQNLAVVARCGK